MPRIPNANTEGVAFMYRSFEEAQKRARLGGCAFLVGRPIKRSKEIYGQVLFAPYLVSNSHVVFEGGACVATVNRLDGNPPDIWDIDQNHWVEHPGGDDVAVTPIFTYLKKSVHQARFIQETMFLTQSEVESLAIGLGDEVYMLGRFINMQGTESNLPAARFGSISAMLTMIPQKRYQQLRLQESYAVEMRSRTGFSGAPVCLYRNAATILDEDVPQNARALWRLLGVNWGYVKEYIEDGEENTWLNGVAPAWKISETLDTPALRAVQEGIEAQMLEHAELGGTIAGLFKGDLG